MTARDPGSKRRAAPAPWFAHRGGTVMDKDGEPVALVYRFADLALLSAAPDLLDIAQRIEAMLTAQRWLPDGDAPESVLLRDTRAAITKASGAPT